MSSAGCEEVRACWRGLAVAVVDVVVRFVSPVMTRRSSAAEMRPLRFVDSAALIARVCGTRDKKKKKKKKKTNNKKRSKS